MSGDLIIAIARLSDAAVTRDHSKDIVSEMSGSSKFIEKAGQFTVMATARSPRPG